MKPGDVRVNCEEGAPGVYLLLERRAGHVPQWNASRQGSSFEWLMLVIEPDPELEPDERAGKVDVASEHFLEEWTVGLEP